MFSLNRMKFCGLRADMKYGSDKTFIFRRGCLKTDETKNVKTDSSQCRPLSIKERVEAADYAMEIKGTNSADEDVSDVIGEVYGG